MEVQRVTKFGVWTAHIVASLFCISIINYLVFLVWSEVSHYFEIIGVVVRHRLIVDVTKHML